MRVATGLAPLLCPTGDCQAAAITAVLTRRDCSWLAVCLAAMRVSSPLLALSADVQSEGEVERTKRALAEHRPAVVVLDKHLCNKPAAAPVLQAHGENGGTPHGLLVVYVEDLLTTSGLSIPPH
eukprot:1707046-Amphidinium_carterae.1